MEKINLFRALEDLERSILEKTIKAYPSNHSKQAKALSLLRTTLIYKLKKYGLFTEVKRDAKK